MFSSAFALTIGIDKYRYPLQVPMLARGGINPAKTSRYVSLTGAVADADAFEDYLLSRHMPRDSIRRFRNEEATRDSIINALCSMQTDDRIQKNDPIIIYYAGHGATGNAPVEWHYQNRAIQVLVPCDISPDDTIAAAANRPPVHGITDRTLCMEIGGWQRASEGSLAIRKQPHI
ncbi:hypothetical protein BDW22DRAFT_1431754 [Trametopsis cervina]|nr:hypothetical protein BDW22DRAFT_1431754 [Trametopsis cervina]